MNGLKKVLNKSTNLVYKFLEKISDLIKKEENALFIKTIIKLVILILIYFICGLIAEGMILIGTHIIYYFGTSARALLSGIWSIVVNFTYFLFIIVSLYRLLEIAEKDNKFFNLYKNKKKDKEVKNKIFFTLETLIKFLRIIILIPLFVVDIGLLFIFGILIGYAKEGIYLYSLFSINIGLVIFFTAIIFLIKELLSPGDSKLKKYLYIMIISGLLVSISSITILFETSNYKTNKSLTTDFTTSNIKYEYKINSKKDYFIYNDGKDTNLELVIDDDLGSYLEIIITHSTTNEVSTKVKDEQNKVKIMYDQDLNLHFSDLEKILNLGVTCVKEKTFYNYTLLKYATVEVRVSSEYAENIKFVDEKGKVYTPYERIDK